MFSVMTKHVLPEQSALSSHVIPFFQMSKLRGNNQIIHGSDRSIPPPPTLFCHFPPSLSLSLSLSHSHSLFHTLTLSDSLSLSLALTQTLSDSVSHSLSHTHTHTHVWTAVLFAGLLQREVSGHHQCFVSTSLSHDLWHTKERRKKRYDLYQEAAELNYLFCVVERDTILSQFPLHYFNLFIIDSLAAFVQLSSPCAHIKLLPADFHCR